MGGRSYTLLNSVVQQFVRLTFLWRLHRLRPVSSGAVWFV